MSNSTNSQSESKVFERDWCAYYNAVQGYPPRVTLLAALERFDIEKLATQSRFALDLGCGDGRDTAEMLGRGWRVLAIDDQPEALARLEGRPHISIERLEILIAGFEEVNFPGNVDLVNASFALPFCPPEHFPNLWEKIVACLSCGGRFSGQLFGDRDSWAIYPSMTHHTRTQAETLLQPFDIEVFEEEEHPEKTVLGEEKYSHLFNIVARKL